MMMMMMIDFVFYDGCRVFGLKNIWPSEFPIELEFTSVGWREENPENPEETPLSKKENQQQTQPTNDDGSGNRNRATLVESERSHYCTIPVPQRLFKIDSSLTCVFQHDLTSAWMLKQENKALP